MRKTEREGHFGWINSPKGDPEAIRLAGERFGRVADVLGTQVLSLHGVMASTSEADWKGPASQQFGSFVGLRTRELGRSAGAMRDTGAELVRFAGALERAQRLTEKADRDAHAANAEYLREKKRMYDYQDLQRRAGEAAARAKMRSEKALALSQPIAAKHADEEAQEHTRNEGRARDKAGQAEKSKGEHARTREEAKIAGRKALDDYSDATFRIIHALVRSEKAAKKPRKMGEPPIPVTIRRISDDPYLMGGVVTGLAGMPRTPSEARIWMNFNGGAAGGMSALQRLQKIMDPINRTIQTGAKYDMATEGVRALAVWQLTDLDPLDDDKYTGKDLEKRFKKRSGLLKLVGLLDKGLKVTKVIGKVAKPAQAVNFTVDVVVRVKEGQSIPEALVRETTQTIGETVGDAMSVACGPATLFCNQAIVPLTSKAGDQLGYAPFKVFGGK